MNYIYDVVLNFQNEYYDFYEWNKNDNIYHMRKIPIIKVSDKCFLEIKNNITKLDEETFKRLSIKAERFKLNTIAKLKNTIILSTRQNAMAIKFDKNGIIKFKSSLLPDEEDDVIEIIKFQSETKLNYEIVQYKNKSLFKTRFELENEKFIKDELEKVYEQKNIQKLNYIYLECFNKQERNIKLAYEKLKKEIKQPNDNFIKIYNIFNMSRQK